MNKKQYKEEMKQALTRVRARYLYTWEELEDYVYWERMKNGLTLPEAYSAEQLSAVASLLVKIERQIIEMESLAKVHRNDNARMVRNAWAQILVDEKIVDDNLATVKKYLNQEN